MIRTFPIPDFDEIHIVFRNKFYISEICFIIPAWAKKNGLFLGLVIRTILRQSSSAEVSRIRQAGFAVYSNRRTAGNHVEVTEYRLGTPSRRLVAAGYKAIALGLA